MTMKLEQAVANQRHPMKTARGLGAARSGLHHWWMQRVTAVALVPLSVWFLWHSIELVHADYIRAFLFLADPMNAVLMLIFATTLLYHSYLGLQVVVEDYVGGELTKLATLVGLQFIHVLLAVMAAFAVLKVSLGGFA
jgi:succinate dehydrogenase / fumarate reductase membrane anchor subunit